MCQRSIISVVVAGLLATAATLRLAPIAHAEELKLASTVSPPATHSFGSELSLSSAALTIGYLTPAYGSIALGMLAPSLRPSSGAGFGFTSNFNARLYGASIGVFGSAEERPSILALAPATSWTMGASVGFAGFYLRGGVNDAPQASLYFRTQGWQAGFGYETGALDLRLSYVALQGAGAFGVLDRELESQQWIIGGIYQISPRLRLNADAFYGARDARGILFATPSASPQTPQGRGARVGVQLRF